MAKLFTKSAFKQALTCPASLYYYHDRENYANQMNEDDFLQALADGGNQVGDLAKVYYGVQPDADIRTLDYGKSVEITADLMKRDEVNIAEAAFRWMDCFVRADIIEKKGKVINLVEVKAKSWDPTKDSFWGKGKNAGSVNSDIREYVYDVAFQKYVIQNALGPEYTVKAHLMLADKSVVSDAPNGVNQFFEVVKNGDRTEIVRKAGAVDLVDYAHVLTAFPVDDVCTKILAGETGEQEAFMGCRFKEFVERMSKAYVNHERIWCNVSATCFKCPFYSNEKTPGMLDGKKECWERMAGFEEKDFSEPLVEDLWGAFIKRDKFIQEKKYFLRDLGKEDFNDPDTSKPGLHHIQRKLVQIALATGRVDELIPDLKANIHGGVYLDIPGLKAEMATWRYPLHMIDFETTAVALPFYEGMRPYEQVAFQFSHHIIEKDGTIRHAGQYINTLKNHNPNFEFVEELKRQLDTDGGTIFRYAAHENSILRAIYEQLSESDYGKKDELMEFIDSITHYKDGSRTVAGPRDMVDLLEVVKKYYYHPDMEGSNSIKVVLPAILNSSEAIRKKYSEPIYGSVIKSKNFTSENAKSWITVGPDGKVENPYKHLDAIATFLGVSTDELEEFDTAAGADESIANGGAALAAYTKLQFSKGSMSKALEDALLRYCELDTMSMVFIWEYFHEMTGM